MTEQKPAYKKKLIEVAIPLEQINEACIKEKGTRRGHPSSLHQWWARRPFGSARAVILSQLIDDPSEYMSEKDAKLERKKIHNLIKKIVYWENSSDATLINQVRLLIAQSIERNEGKKLKSSNAEEVLKYLETNAPTMLDPFAGGGSIPLEAQRLGLKSVARDLNPVAVTINKGLIEIPFLFIDMFAVNPLSNPKLFQKGSGYSGLAEDIRYYGEALKTLVLKKISKYYPPVKDKKGKELNVVAWIWARTVPTPNPAYKNTPVPLIKSFWLCNKAGKETWIEPLIDKEKFVYTFTIRNGKGKVQEGTTDKMGGRCLLSNSPISLDYIRQQGNLGKMGLRLMAIAARDGKKLTFIEPNIEQEEIAQNITLNWVPNAAIPEKALGFRVQLYGLKEFSELFSKRQLLALTTISDTLAELYDTIYRDALKRGFTKDDTPLQNNGKGARAYSECIIFYLSLALGRLAEYNSTMTYWDERAPSIAKTFSLPTLQMRLSYPETNPFGDFSGNWTQMVENVAETVQCLYPKIIQGVAQQYDATAENWNLKNIVVCTDPPYYDNIGYACLSDFFYIWLRKPLKKIYPDIFSTLMTPKDRELISEPARHHNSKQEASSFFEEGLFRFSTNAVKSINPNYPMVIFYAFKQSETDEEGTASTGWEVFLSSLVKAGFQITSTLPMRTEQSGGLRIVGRNSLASSIIVVCRPHSLNSPLSTRREFINSLKKELPSALKKLQEAGITPVDLAQSSIGPGMAVFSRYSKVLEADGNPMNVRTALQIINQELDSYFSEQEADMDKETRFCIAWYEQFGWKEAPFGDANTLATAKGTAVNALENAGVIYAKAGKVRLLRRTELDANWDPTTDKKLTVWECVQYLIKALEDKGENGAGKILKKIGGLSEPVKELAYRLYALCEKKRWTEDSLAYNNLISSWQSVTDKAQFAEQVSEETKKKLKDKSQKTLKDI